MTAPFDDALLKIRRGKGRLASSQAKADYQSAFEDELSAAYEARSAWEMALTCAKECVRLKCTTQRGASEAWLKTEFQRIPHTELLRRVRVHDFHRRPLQPQVPSSKVTSLAMSGPITLRAKKGMALVVFGEKGPEFRLTGESTVEHHGGELVMQNGRFLDPQSGRFVRLYDATDEHLVELRTLIRDLDRCRSTATMS